MISLNDCRRLQENPDTEQDTIRPSPGDGTSETTPRTGTSVTSDDRTITGGSSQGPGEIRIEVQIENAVCVLYTEEKLLVSFAWETMLDTDFRCDINSNILSTIVIF